MILLSIVLGLSVTEIRSPCLRPRHQPETVGSPEDASLAVLAWRRTDSAWARPRLCSADCSSCCCCCCWVPRTVTSGDQVCCCQGSETSAAWPRGSCLAPLCSDHCPPCWLHWWAWQRWWAGWPPLPAMTQHHDTINVSISSELLTWDWAGVLAPLVLAVTAATMMSLGLCLGLSPAEPWPLLTRDDDSLSLDSRSGGRLLSGPLIIGSSRRGGDGPDVIVKLHKTCFSIVRLKSRAQFRSMIMLKPSVVWSDSRISSQMFRWQLLQFTTM